jgi:hypothetical protein
MGAARREREQPWRHDPSPAERLWYRGLIARAFFDDGQGPQEFVFIPDDVRPLVPARAATLASPGPPGQPLPLPAACDSAMDFAVDDVTTLLAYLQIASVRLEGAALPLRHRTALTRFLRLPAALDFFLHLVVRLGLASGTPLKLDPALARPFLEASRSEQVATLVPAWRDSREWNDLIHVPGLVFEGKAWRNDPLAARSAILKMLAQVPSGEWWSLDAFVLAVKDRQPDFQRPAGDYDSWYIRDADTQAYLRGFENWERVDGALVRWVVAQPLYALGLVELGRDPTQVLRAEGRGEAQVTAFRITPYGAAFFGHAEWPAAPMASPLQVGADGRLRVPASASRYDRFQVARVSNWLPPQIPSGDYLYRLAPASLVRAAKQGIKVNHILAFLLKAAGGEALPPALVGALHRWERAGGEAALQETAVLKVKSPELLETLQRTPAVKRYLGESLGPAAVEVRLGDMDRLREALAEVGILVD